MRTPPPRNPLCSSEGGKGGGSVLASPDISPRASTLHAPRLAPQVPLGAPPLKEGRTLLRLQNGGCRALIPPSRQPTHPYFHLSGALLEEKRGDGLFGWVGRWRGGIPCSIPTNFLISFGSNALSQIHAPNLSTIQPLPPPTAILCHFGYSC